MEEAVESDVVHDRLEGGIVRIDHWDDNRVIWERNLGPKNHGEESKYEWDPSPGPTLEDMAGLDWDNYTNRYS